MKILKKIFGGIEMTWVKVIIFSVATAVVTAALLLLPVFKDSALAQMGVFLDWWFIFAIFIVSNCKKPLEAGLKCFVFFLISQPLIYLIQQPFASVNLIQAYYGKWFIITLLTFPGAMIAFQIKRKEMWSALILAVAGAYLGIVGIGRMTNAIFEGNALYVIDGLFFAVVAVLFGFIFCSGKKRILYLSIILACIIGFGGYTVYDNLSSGTFEYDIQQEGVWNIKNGSYENVIVDFADDDTITIEHGSSGSGEFTVANEKGDTINYIVTVKGGKVTLSESK